MPGNAEKAVCSVSLNRSSLDPRTRRPRPVVLSLLVLVVACLMSFGCRFSQADAAPSISFTKVPISSPGGPYTHDSIEGRATGAKPGQRIVLYARSGVWWV